MRASIFFYVFGLIFISGFGISAYKSVKQYAEFAHNRPATLAASMQKSFE